MSSRRPKQKQTLEERLKLRSELREESKFITEMAADIANPESDALEQALGRSDALFANVQTTREGVMDSINVANIAKAFSSQAEALRKSCAQFTFDKLRAALRRKGLDEDGSFHWDHLGTAAGLGFKTAPAARSLYGVIPFEEGKEMERLQEAKKQKQALAKEARERAKVVSEQEKEVVATQLDNVQQRKRALDPPVVRMGRLNRALKRHCNPAGPSSTIQRKLPAVQFVSNPESFSQTVENVFDLSFLCTTGYARLEKDGAGDIVVSPSEPPDADEVMEHDKRQAIVTLTPQNMAAVLEAYRLQNAEPMLGSRGPEGVVITEEDDAIEYSSLLENVAME